MILDKPYGMTSTQAVGKIRWLFNAEKAGHGGTLDPLASGLLPIALGEATKTVSYAMDGRKIYRFTACWGEERTTDDLEGEVTARSDKRPTRTRSSRYFPASPARSCRRRRPFRPSRSMASGPMTWRGPARRWNCAERPVLIEELRLVDVPDADHATFEVTCGKGTYIRSLARDMGRALGLPRHVSMLRRVAVGPFTEAHMISLENLDGTQP